MKQKRQKQQKDRIRISQEGNTRQTALIGWMKQSLTGWFILAGMWNTMGIFVLDSSQRVQLGLIGAVVVCLLAAGTCRKNIQQLLWGLGFAGAAVIFAVKVSMVLRAAVYLRNAVVSSWNVRYEAYHSILSAEATTTADLYWFFLVVMLLLLTVLMILLEKRSVIVFSIFLCVYLFLLALIGFADQKPAQMICYLAGLLMGWHYMITPKTMRWQGGLLPMGLLFAGLALIVFLGRGTWVEQLAVNWNTQAKETIQKVRYGEDSLPQGQFQKVSEMNEGQEERLELTVDTPQELYLRGYVGTEYTQSGWKKLSYRAYSEEYNGILDWLKTQEFQSGSQYGSYRVLEQKYNGKDVKTSGVQMKNTGADRRYAYLPANLYQVQNGSIRQEQDWEYRTTGLFGKRDYLYLVSQDETMTELMNQQDWLNTSAQSEVQQYAVAEEVYRSFVYAQYLTVEESEKQLLENVFTTEDDSAEDTVYEITGRIRTILAGLIEYRDEPDAYADGDYISYILKDSRNGNSAAFATIAAMAYRCKGIPARYVEGYYLSSQQASEKSVILTSQDAHAWVEIYLDGVGWIPMETTPGFYSQTGGSQKLIKMEDALNGGSQKKSSSEKISAYDDSKLQQDSEEEEEVEPEIASRELAGGVLMLILILVCTGLFLLIIRIEQRSFGMDRKLQKMSISDRTRFLYTEIIHELHRAGVAIDERHPYEAESAFLDKFQGISVWEYRQMIAVVQKGIFSGSEIAEYEARFLQEFYKMLQG